MNLELLKTFLAVVREGGMRAAAHELHITQPAVSARIREFESQLEAALFERLGRRLIPTEAGRLLLEESTELLAAEEALVHKIDELRGLRGGRLTLATIDAVSIYVLPEVYLGFRHRYPGVDLRVQVIDSGRVLSAVRDLDVQVGFLALPPTFPQQEVHPDVDVVPIFEDRLVCVAAPGNPLAQKRSCQLSTLLEQPLVLYDSGSTTRALLDAHFSARGLTPNVVMETTSPEAMKRLAEVGVGIAILPEEQVRADVARGSLRQLHVRDARFVRMLGTAVRRGRRLSLAARHFLELVHQRWPPLTRFSRILP